MHTLLETLIVLPDGRQVRLGDVVTVTPRNVLANILRENQQYQRTVAYDFHGPVRLGDAVLYILACTPSLLGFLSARGEEGLRTKPGSTPSK